MPEPYAICLPCGDKKYPGDKDLGNITVWRGDCEMCGKKNVTLIPQRDFRMLTK